MNKMSGLDEQNCNIGVCPCCDRDILTWSLKCTKNRTGHFNIDTGGTGYLNNTLYLYEGYSLSDIIGIKCYHCNYHETDKNSLFFKSLLRKAYMAIIREK